MNSIPSHFASLLVQPPFLFSAEANAEHVVLPIGEDARSLFCLPNAEEKYLHQRRKRLGA